MSACTHDLQLGDSITSNICELAPSRVINWMSFEMGSGVLHSDDNSIKVEWAVWGRFGQIRFKGYPGVPITVNDA